MENEKDYARLIAAQNTAAREFEIKKIQNTLTEEHRRKNMMAIASGVMIAGLVASMHFSGIDPNEALAVEMKALNSFEALKQYFSMFTPATYAAAIGTVVSLEAFIKHAREYKKANQDFYAMMDSVPEDYQDVVESQARSR